MRTAEELEKKLWKALKADRTLMLWLEAEAGHPRPMTALLETESHGPAWIFTSTENPLAERARAPVRACASFASMGHDLFASLQGVLLRDDDRAAIDRLWNPFIAAWYDGGKDDPTLALLRFEPAHAEIWSNENSLWAGMKILLGADPKKEYQDHVAGVDLRH